MRFNDCQGDEVLVGQRVAYIVEPVDGGAPRIGVDTVVGFNDGAVEQGAVPCVYFANGAAYASANVAIVSASFGARGNG